MQPLRQQVEKYLSETDWEMWKSVPDNYEAVVEEGILKVASKMKADGMALEKISSYTGLTIEDIEDL